MKIKSQKTYIEDFKYYGTNEGKGGTLYNLFSIIDKLYFRNIYKGNDIVEIENHIDSICKDYEFIKNFGSYIKPLFLYYKEIVIKENVKDLGQLLHTEYHSFIKSKKIESKMNPYLINQNSLKINRIVSRIYNKVIPLHLHSEIPIRYLKMIDVLSKEGELSGVHYEELLNRKLIERKYLDNPKYMIYLSNYIDYSEWCELIKLLTESYKTLFNILNYFCDDSIDMFDTSIKEIVEKNSEICVEIYMNYEEYIKPFQELGLTIGTVVQSKKKYYEVLSYYKVLQ